MEQHGLTTDSLHNTMTHSSSSSSSTMERTQRHTDDRTEGRLDLERSTTRLEFGPDGLGYTGILLSEYFVKRRR